MSNSWRRERGSEAGAEWNVYPNSKPSPLNGSSFPHSPSLLKATRRWWWWRRKRRRVDWQPSPPIAKRIAVSLECPAQGIAQLGEGTVTLVLREHGDFSHFNDGSLLGPQYRLWLSLSHAHTLSQPPCIARFAYRSQLAAVTGSRRSFSSPIPQGQGLLNRH